MLYTALAAGVLAAAGCGGGSDHGQAPAAPAGDANPDSEICAAAHKEAAHAGALPVLLIVDRTASARTLSTTPPGVGEVIARVQQEGLNGHKGSEVQAIAVTGTSTFPPIGAPLNLDPRPGDTSQNADNIRAKILRDCVPGLFKADGGEGGGDTTDLIGALLAAKQQGPAQILVVSSGVNNTAVANLNPPPADPAEAVGAVKADAPAFDDWSIPVTWFSLGEPQTPLSAQDHDRVVGFWKALLGDKLTVDDRE